MTGSNSKIFMALFYDVESSPSDLNYIHYKL